jgi:hypothetical protein
MLSIGSSSSWWYRQLGRLGSQTIARDSRQSAIALPSSLLSHDYWAAYVDGWKELETKEPLRGELENKGLGNDDTGKKARWSRGITCPLMLSTGVYRSSSLCTEALKTSEMGGRRRSKKDEDLTVPAQGRINQSCGCSGSATVPQSTWSI